MSWFDTAISWATDFITEDIPQFATETLPGLFSPEAAYEVVDGVGVWGTEQPKSLFAEYGVPLLKDLGKGYLQDVQAGRYQDFIDSQNEERRKLAEIYSRIYAQDRVAAETARERKRLTSQMDPYIQRGGQRLESGLKRRGLKDSSIADWENFQRNQYVNKLMSDIDYRAGQNVASALEKEADIEEIKSGLMQPTEAQMSPRYIAAATYNPWEAAAARYFLG